MVNDVILRQKILDYADNPINYGMIKNPDIKAYGVHPIGNDRVTITAKLKNEKLMDIKFKADGCTICKAYASMTTELVMGKSLQEIQSMTETDVIKNLNIDLSPKRLQCALLCFRTIKQALLGN